MQFEKLTEQQKLHSLAARFYQELEWVPKEGDYYTTSRADLELYRVVDIKDGKVFTEYCTNPGLNIAEWDQSEFTTGGFGPKRVYVPDWILEKIN